MLNKCIAQPDPILGVLLLLQSNIANHLRVWIRLFPFRLTPVVFLLLQCLYVFGQKPSCHNISPQKLHVVEFPWNEHMVDHIEMTWQIRLIYLNV